jgi:glycosyltransferase 2 family protein
MLNQESANQKSEIRNRKMKSVAKLLIKIAVTALCLWYVTKKIDWTLTWSLLQESNKWWLMSATVLVALSKIVSAFRLNIYFKNIAINLADKNSLQLYWLGMFYNLFLPGGIGGDAYKVILLNKEYKEVPTKKIAAAVLLDRISGVVALGLLAAVFYWFTYRGANYSWWLVAAILPGQVVYYWGVKKIFPSFLPGFYPTFFMGLAVQMLQVLCVWCIMQSVGIEGHFAEFQFLFLLSSIVAILPFTIGGLGAREVVFLWGAAQFALDAHQAVYISILFYLIHLLVSLAGLRWVYKSPLKNEL